MSEQQPITIDASTTRDRDDAFWITEDESGTTVSVYISNVAAAVPRGHKFDVGDPEKGRRGAYDRVETRYYADGNSPMLPRFLSERDLSLNPKEERDATLIRVHLGPDGRPSGLPHVGVTKITSRAALAYPQIPAILEDEEHEFHDQIRRGKALALRLLAHRREAGALAIYDLNHGWVLNEDGLMIKLPRDEATIGYVIIQELMILANAELTRWCAHQGIPVLYRNHAARANAPEREVLIEQVETAIGSSLGVIQQLRERFNLVMERAVYHPTLSGHYGLNLPGYMHATSPIRRYADLVSWRQILAHLAGEELPYTQADLVEVAEHINNWVTENKARKSEHMRRKDTRRLNRTMEIMDALRHLSNKEFTRLLRRILRGEVTAGDHFFPELHRRLTSGAAPLACRELILAEAPHEEPWVAPREHVAQTLLDHPHDAVSILMMTSQISGWSPPRYAKGDGGGEAHARTFVSQARIQDSNGVRHKSPVVSASSLKGAQQRAAAALLAALVGLPLPSGWAGDPAALKRSKRPSAAPTKKAKAKPVLGEPTSNPVGQLQEYCSQVGWDAPTYTSGPSQGPSHSPTFAVSCTVQGVTGTANAASKKAAKRQAAADAIRRLRAS